MELEVFPGRAIVFDLDDTLYRESDFVDSGFRAVLKQLGSGDDPGLLDLMWAWQRDGHAVFDNLIRHLGSQISNSELLEIYRFHEPRIGLNEGAEQLIRGIKAGGGRVGIITDGRSRTQRAKIRALGLDLLVDAVIVSEEIGSEKPDPRNFLAAKEKLGSHDHVYFGDNPRKDFVVPNEMGWLSVMVWGDGSNIHRQDIEVPAVARPQFMIQSLVDVQLSMTSEYRRTLNP